MNLNEFGVYTIKITSLNYYNDNDNENILFDHKIQIYITDLQYFTNQNMN